MRHINATYESASRTLPHVVSGILCKIHSLIAGKTWEKKQEWTRLHSDFELPDLSQ